MENTRLNTIWGHPKALNTYRELTTIYIRELIKTEVVVLSRPWRDEKAYWINWYLFHGQLVLEGESQSGE